MIHENLQFLRRAHGYSQEEVAERIGVSRQAVAKWESGETIPDLPNTQALAAFYDITLDELVNHHDGQGGALISPKGKHIFGLVRVGERGQIVIPKQAREVFSISAGDQLLVLGDEEQGIAIVKADLVQSFAHELMKAAQREKDLPRGGRGGEGE